jgi:CRISPR/Cas system-associated endoribonuclease Cas2
MKGDESHIKQFIRLMEYYLHKKEDSLLIIELCAEDLSKREKYGVENPDEKFYNQHFHIL